MTKQLTWLAKQFQQLSTIELYDFFKLRVDVFVVEQACFYHEIDDADKHSETIHILAYSNKGSQKELAAYLRILPKGTSYKDSISIGRVVVSPEFRGQKIGHLLVKKALEICKEAFPQQNIKISAQEHLQAFYEFFGFVRVSDMYLEDNIPHISMKLQQK